VLRAGRTGLSSGLSPALLGKTYESSDPAQMCNLYSITTDQAAIIGVINQYVGNLPPMPRDKGQAGSGHGS
jgi:hypothetical protein